MLKKYLNIGGVFFWMLLFIPLSFICGIFTQNKILTFVFSILAIIPLARILGYTTKEISLQTNPTIGGLISATFGNIIEVFIAILALREGLVRVVQASIVGSIIGNLLLLIGLSIFFGGLKYKHQVFNNRTANVSSTMLIIAVAGITIPSLYYFLNQNNTHLAILSDSVAIVMALVYVAGLIFSLFTHKDLFDASDEIKATRKRPIISKKIAALILFIATVIVAFESHFLVKGIEEVALHVGITQTFIGVVIIAIVTNIAEKSMAINFALEDKLDISLEIGMSSAIQIALFVVPILVFVSQIMGSTFNLVFSLFEVAAILVAVTIINHLSADGRCNWLEGVQLISVYLILVVVFYFV